MPFTLATDKDLKEGAVFWFKGDRRSYYEFTVRKVKRSGIVFDTVERPWGHEQEVEWTKAEWKKALADNSVALAKPPVTKKDLKRNEELCRMCNGSLWEMERDLEMIPCMWCRGTGVQTKKKEKPQPKARSPLHPKMPS